MALSLSAPPFAMQATRRIASASLLKPSSNPSNPGTGKSSFPTLAANFATNFRPRGVATACYARPLRPVEERFRIQVERNVEEARLEQLNVKRWAKWESDVSAYDHEWKVDEQVYIVKGSVRVVPEDCEDCAYFYAGDLVRFPKWFSATLSFEGEYEQRYRFLAYGDD